MNMIQIKAPETALEWETYYHLRYSILREPWGQPRGSEVLSDEDAATHALALDSDNNKILGVARMQANSDTQVQVRCVAVLLDAQGLGVGKKLMNYLENMARNDGFKEVVLDARDTAVAFYHAIGYETIEMSYLLFGEIQHWRMRKDL